MIKKIAIIATAALFAASTLAEAKTIRVKNDGPDGYFKVGNTVKPIKKGGSRTFKINPNKKAVPVKKSSSSSGGFKSAGKVNLSKGQKGIEVSLNTNQTTPIVN